MGFLQPSNQAVCFKEFTHKYAIDPFHVPTLRDNPDLFEHNATHAYCKKLGIPGNFHIFTHDQSSRYLKAALAEIEYLMGRGALTLSEAKMVYKISYGILGNETYFGLYRSFRTWGQALPSKKHLVLLGRLGKHISIGLTQIKVTLLFDPDIVADKRFLSTDFWQPEHAARWTILSIAMYTKMYDTSQPDSHIRLLCCHNMGPAALTWRLDELISSQYNTRADIAATFLKPITSF